MIGVAGKDTEGSYRPEFVQCILAGVNEQQTRRFHDAKSFLNHLILDKNSQIKHHNR